MTWLSAQQFAGFQRAAARRSRGQVRIPDVRLSLAEATALWTDIHAAFGPAKGRNLAPQELGHLRRHAWRRSDGFASLSAPALSLDAAHAFWRLAGKLGALADRRKASPRSKIAGAAVLGLAATQMAACTTFLGSNIKGSFSCNAPGGTCAPSTVIDDQALSVIQNARPMTPAGPYMRSPASPRATTAAYVPTGSGRITPAQGGMAHRERRVLRVVFPSFVDGGGNLHEPRIVHAVVDDGAWMQLSGSEPTAIDQIEGRSASLASAAFSPPSLPDASILPSDISPPPEAKPAPAGPPSPEAVAAARAKGAALKAGSAIDAIRAEVQSRLAQTAKTPGSVPPAGALAPNAAQGAAHNAAPVDAVKPAAATTPINAPAAFPAKVEE